MKVRLDKFISNNTTYTRTEVCKLIKTKNVLINDTIANIGSIKIDDEIDKVFVNGQIINKLGFIYIAINKPKGFLSSTSYYEQQPSILELISGYEMYDLHLVGRLDLDSTGLIIVTNDGNYTHQLKNPKYNIEKEYEVILEKPLSDEMINKFKQPIKMDGKYLKPFKVFDVKNNYAKVILTEGKHHQVKRLFEFVGNKVVELNRIRIGNLRLSDLKINIGEFCLFNKENVIKNNL